MPKKIAMDHMKDLQLKTFLLIIKKKGKPTETRELDAYNRDYARRWADQMEISENCTITVKIKPNEK